MPKPNPEKKVRMAVVKATIDIITNSIWRTYKFKISKALTLLLLVEEEVQENAEKQTAKTAGNKSSQKIHLKSKK